MYCNKCGNPIEENAKFCMKCGAAVNGEQFVPSFTPQYQPIVQKDKTNTLAIVGFIFSFLFTLVGLICSIIGYKNADSQYGGNGKGLALAGIIISSVTMAIVFVYLIIVFAVIGLYV